MMLIVARLLLLVVCALLGRSNAAAVDIMTQEGKKSGPAFRRSVPNRRQEQAASLRSDGRGGLMEVQEAAAAPLQGSKAKGTVTVKLKPQVDLLPEKLQVGEEMPSSVGPSAAAPVQLVSPLEVVTGGVNGVSSGLHTFAQGLQSPGLVWQASDSAQTGEEGAGEAAATRSEGELMVEAEVSSLTVTLLVVLVYVLAIFGIGFAYTKMKTADMTLADMPKEAISAEQDFSDGLCACASSLPICLTSCLIPCVRWSDTMAQARFESFFKALGIFTSFLVLNSFFSGVGTMAVVALGTVYRVKIRQEYGMLTSVKTHCLDLLSWLCCTPCAIAQEARHVERAESAGLKPKPV